jgi:hypothetical protein
MLCKTQFQGLLRGDCEPELTARSESDSAPGVSFAPKRTERRSLSVMTVLLVLLLALFPAVALPIPKLRYFGKNIRSSSHMSIDS